MKREDGYYWVKENATNWYIAEYIGMDDFWLTTGDESSSFDETFDEINENRIKAPNE